MGYTTDPTDERLGHGVDTAPVPQNEVYLVLSKEERNRGFVRPVRQSYVHYYHPDGSPVPVVLTNEDVRSLRGCGALTKMGLGIAETYARDPKFYGSTYCVGCQMHLPVAEFIWDGTHERVGS